jgi:hypothetical protein
MSSNHAAARQASVLTIDFTKVVDIRQHGSGVVRHAGSMRDEHPMTPEGKLLTPKQIRARARRRLARGGRSRQGAVTEQEFEALYKPIDEWDLEELAKGRPRNSKGKFGGRTPGWITREVHEKAMERFQTVIKSEMSALNVDALDTMRWILQSEDCDEKGKPLVPASVKLQASQFLIEHTVGKPKQHVQQDISVRLQAVLGAVMANPNEALAPPSQGGRLGMADSNTPGYQLAHTPGHTIPMGIEDAIDVEFTDDEDLDMEESA